MSYKNVYLKPGKEESLKRFHPWVFSGAIAKIEGVDLVTEGVITMNKVIQFAKDYLGENELYEEWNFKKDGASLISRLLFEEATDINFYVGRAVNPAHQNPDLPINFNIKTSINKRIILFFYRTKIHIIIFSLFFFS